MRHAEENERSFMKTRNAIINRRCSWHRSVCHRPPPSAATLLPNSFAPVFPRRMPCRLARRLHRRHNTLYPRTMLLSLLRLRLQPSRRRMRRHRHGAGSRTPSVRRRSRGRSTSHPVAMLLSLLRMRAMSGLGGTRCWHGWPQRFSGTRRRPVHARPRTWRQRHLARRLSMRR